MVTDKSVEVVLTAEALLETVAPAVVANRKATEDAKAPRFRIIIGPTRSGSPVRQRGSRYGILDVGH